MPTSLKRPSMFARWPGLAIQDLTTSTGVASLPLPQARFSPTVHEALRV